MAKIKATTAKTPRQPAFPLFEGLTEKKMIALGDKLDKLLDPNGHKHYALLGKHTERSNKELLWHLVRCGLVAKNPLSSGLYRQLGEYIPDDVGAADVIAVLRHVAADMHTLDRGKDWNQTYLTPGMLTEIDELLVHAYLDDPAAVRAVQPELSPNMQLAIDFVRRRAGETIDPASARALFEHLAEQHSSSGLALNIDVPRIVDGARVVSRFADNEAVRELALLFGTQEAWAELQLAWVRSHVAYFRTEINHASQRVLMALRRASLRDLVYLFGDGYWNAPVLVHVLDQREDGTDALLAAADELRRDGLAPFRIDAVQAKPKKEERHSGGDDDDDDDDDNAGDDDYSSDDDYSDDDDHGSDDESDEQEEEPEPGPDNERVIGLAEVLTVVAIHRLVARGLPIPGSCDAAFDLVRLYDSESSFVLAVRAALAHLGPARAHAVIRRVVAKPIYYGKAAAIADVCYDPAIVEEVLTRLDTSEYGLEAELLGLCGPQLIPAIMAHADKVADPKIRTGYREAINYILAHMAAAGQPWDPALDDHLDIGAIRFSYGGSKVASVLALLDGLPLARYEQVLRNNLTLAADEPWTLVRCLRADTSEALLLAVFTALMKRRTAVTSGCLGDRLRTLGVRVALPLRQAFGDTPAQGSLIRELERALDDEAFAQFKASLAGGIETPEQELRRLCAALPGPKVRIYRLRRTDRSPAADEVGRIGGSPRGITDSDIPRHGDEPMQHILTLDLARMPGMSGPAGARSLSLYLPDPDDAEEHESGELVWLREAELAAAPGSTADARAIEVDAFDVPTAIFDERCEGDTKRVRGLVYASNGYALGGPLWLQDGPTGADPDFLFQFDEGLCSINLGDCGVMYVHGGEITWQCH